MRYDADTMLQLLPAAFRGPIPGTEGYDEDQTAALRDLLAVLAEQVEVVQDNLHQLYEDLFIETCAPWVAPYIGALVGYTPLKSVPPEGARLVAGSEVAAASTRAEIANLIGLRRRKGTLSALEQLASDVLGCPTRAAEMFRRVATLAQLSLIDGGRQSFLDLRDLPTLQRLGSPFETTLRMPHVQRVEHGNTLPNLPNVALFAWQQRAEEFIDVDAAPAALGVGRFLFDPAGCPIQLVNRPRLEQSVDSLAEPMHVPEPLPLFELYRELETIRSRIAMGEDVEAAGVDARYFGEDPVIEIELPDGVVPREQILTANMPDNNAAAHRPWRLPAATRAYPGPANTTVNLPIRVAIDPSRGRLAFAGAVPAWVRVRYLASRVGLFGAGTYERGSSFATAPGEEVRLIRVGRDQTFTTLQAAIAELDGRSGTIEIVDNATYTQPLTLAARSGSRIEIRAANGRRPALAPTSAWAITGEGAEVSLNGLLLVAQPIVLNGTLASLSIRHCTLVPGRRPNSSSGIPLAPGAASIQMESGFAGRTVDIEIFRSVCGAIRVAGDFATVRVLASVIDAADEPTQAEPRQVRVGEARPAFAGLASPRQMQIDIDAAGPRLFAVPSNWASLSNTAVGIRRALRNQSTIGAAFCHAAAHENRFVFVSGSAATPEFADSASTTASQLGLAAGSQVFQGWLGGPRPGFAGLSDPDRRVRVTVAEGTFDLALPAVANIVAACSALQTALRATGAASLAQAIVLPLEDRILVAAPTRMRFREHANDPSSLGQLGLAFRPAIAGSSADPLDGPVIEMQDATVFGHVVCRTAEISNCLIDGVLTCDRLQEGCVRFSWTRAGSRGPRMYRCQPDSAGDCISIRPRFQSRRWWEAGFAVLTTDAPSEIAAGADDGGEFGVHHELYRGIRHQNLRTRLDEYLRLGLAAGVLDPRS